MKDYYDILGVKRSAPVDEIKRAYRRLARRFHPDVSNELEAEARFKEMKEAYEVLKDPEKRKSYDQFGDYWEADQDFTPPPDWDREFIFDRGGFRGASRAAGGGVEGFGDFFDALFGGDDRSRGRFHTGFGGSGSRDVRMDGEDVNAQITIPIEDAYRGAKREIAIEVPEVNNQGRLIRRQRILNVSIPRGIMAGQRIRLANQGGPGVGLGSRSGDLYLTIEIQPHSFYRVHERDIHIALPVSPAEAALGRIVKAPTLGGLVDLGIPPGSSTGKRLRLKGRGLPGNPPGDQYVELKIVLPERASRKARELYQQLEREETFNPRAGLGV